MLFDFERFDEFRGCIGVDCLDCVNGFLIEKGWVVWLFDVVICDLGEVGVVEVCCFDFE